MYMVINRWKLLPGKEHLFEQGWTEIIHRNIKYYGARGSRLHRGDDNTWISYSIWESREHWLSARHLDDADQEARQKMLEAIKQEFEPMTMVPILDHLMDTKLESENLV